MATKVKRKTKKRAVTSKGAAILTKISRRAKQIRKGKENWPGTIKRATSQLKREGKI
jgi:hypothetical protein